TEWMSYSTGLPQSYTRTLQVWYNGGKLFNATTGRGVFEIDLYETPAPVANLGANRQQVNCLDQSVHFYDLSYMDTVGATYQWSFPGGIPNSSNDRDPIVNYPNPGVYDATLSITNGGGTDSLTLNGIVEHVAVLADVPFQEDFNQPALPENWVIENPDESYTWSVIDLDTGSTCQPTTAYFIDHYGYNNPPAEDYLYSQLINLQFIENAELIFDYAYARWGGGNQDGFRVEISTDCGVVWDTIFNDCCESLMTVENNQQSWWAPGCGDWEQLSFDLATYYGENVLIRFVGVNGWGNNFFLDNVEVDGINVLGMAELLPEEGARIYPNPTSNQVYLQSTLDEVTVQMLDLSGKFVLDSRQFSSGLHSITLSGISSGIYFIRLTSNNGERIEKLVVK
ncbi:T9SS type A sorting domain-containing protein, partial [Flavobacteriales bacterium]|nr:T9SS type A sorting domain-containing protein [Flavobacteriales bacterium]